MPPSTQMCSKFPGSFDLTSMAFLPALLLEMGGSENDADIVEISCFEAGFKTRIAFCHFVIALASWLLLLRYYSVLGWGWDRNPQSKAA